MIQTITNTLTQWEKRPYWVSEIFSALSFITSVLIYFNTSFTIIASIWVALVFRLIVNWCITGPTEKINEIVNTVSTQVSTATIKAIDAVGNHLTGVTEQLNQGMTLDSLCYNANRHKIGLAACTKTLVNAKNVPDIVSESVKIGSMLGVETAIITKICASTVDTLNTTMRSVRLNVDENIEHLDSYGGGIEESLPFIGMLASMTGKTINKDLNFDKFITQSANQTKSLKILVDQMSILGKRLGIIKDKNHDEIFKLLKEIDSLQEEYMWVVQTLAINGSDFLKPAQRRRFKAFSTKIMDIDRKTRCIPKMRDGNNKLFSDVQGMVRKSLDYINQVELIEKTNGIRPLPVGVCIQGPSQIGKSTLISIITRKVKESLTEHDDFIDAMSWSTWNTNQKEETFDEGYRGQEIAYWDDCFQRKDCKDHVDFYQKGNTNAIGTCQANINEKGSPYRAKLHLATTNCIPTTSTTVNCIEALHERFPITVKVDWIAGKKDLKSTALDPNFEHMKFKMGTMIEHVNDPENTKVVTLEEIVEKITSSIILNNQKYLALLETNQAIARAIEPEVVLNMMNDEDWDQNEIDDAVTDSFESVNGPIIIPYQPTARAGIPTELPQDQIRTLLSQRPGQAREEFEQDQEMAAAGTPLPAVVAARNRIGNFSTIADRGVQSIAMTEMTYELWMQGKTACGLENMTSITQLQPWYLSLTRREDGATFREVLKKREVDLLKPDEFIKTLGIWEVKPKDENLFYHHWSRQGFVKIEDSETTTEYIWTPRIANGTVLTITNMFEQTVQEAWFNGREMNGIGPIDRVIWEHHVRAALAVDNPRDPNQQRLRTEYRERMLNVLGHMGRFVRTSIGFMIPIAVPIAASATIVIATAVVIPPMAYRATANVLTRTAEIIGDRVPYLTTMLDKMKASWAFLREKISWMKEKMISILMSALNFLGINTDNIWDQIAQIGSLVVSEVMIIVILSVLCYMFYKLWKYITKANEEEEEVDVGELVAIQVIEGDENKVFRMNNSAPVVAKKQAKTKILRDSLKKNSNKFKLNCDKSTFDLIDLNNPKHHNGRIQNLREEGSDHVMFYTTKTETTVQNDKITMLRSESRKVFGEFSYVIDYNFEYTASDIDIVEKYDDFINKVKTLEIEEYLEVIHWSYIPEMQLYHVKVEFCGLKARKEGSVVPYTRKMLKGLTELARDLMTNVNREADNNVQDVLDGIKLNIQTDVYTTLKDHNEVWIQVVKHFDNIVSGGKMYGIGHRDTIIHNAHFCDVGEIIRFKRKDAELYGTAVCEWRDETRDIAYSTIISKKELSGMEKRPPGTLNNVSPVKDHFRSIIDYIPTLEEWSKLDHAEIVSHFPVENFQTFGVIELKGRISLKIENQGRVTKNILKLRHVYAHNGADLSGNCGGIVCTTSDKRKQKLLGFHAGNLPKTNIVICAWLCKEDLIELKLNSDLGDDMQKLIIKGDPIDFPGEDKAKFAGHYAGNNLPISSFKSKWVRAPFEGFESDLIPSALNPYDPRIKKELPKNMLGVPSLLIGPNSLMMKELPKYEENILEFIEQVLSQEMRSVLGEFPGSSDNIEKMLDEALNGRPEYIYCTGMEINTSAGLPWGNYNSKHLKKDWLDKDDDGHVTFNDTNGQILKNRVKRKIIEGNKNKRLISLNTSKLKSELTKPSKVEQGNTRVFSCSPVDSVITQAALFVHFKEAYTKAGLDIHHAIGINAHSLAWDRLATKLQTLPNYFDLDYKNFDKMLSRDLMECAFNIIIQVCKRPGDTWYQARRVAMQESICSLMVDFNTVYITDHGNKSGDYMTTIVNCICNDILSLYCWIKLTGIYDLKTFRDNFVNISFGDDKISSVSDKYKDKINYLTCKRILEEKGHIITPGVKENVEKPFVDFSELQFLKRKFINIAGLWYGKLEKRSIENPFVWTVVEEHEYTMWISMIGELLKEASLHGKDYYNRIKRCLDTCSNPILSRRIGAVCATTWETAVVNYRRNYYD
jgi:hypothetical protein